MAQALICVNATIGRWVQYRAMTQTASPFDADALSRSVPRYTSYPTAPHFSADFAPETYERWLGELDRDAAVSLYLHIPFCDELCWFCACRTQGSKMYYPVTRYLAQIEREITRVAELTGGGQTISQMHWGGGSPTVLAPGDIRRLHRHVREHFPAVENAEFAVEIDPRDMTPDRFEALKDVGLTRASIGVQDFDQRVQAVQHQLAELHRAYRALVTQLYPPSEVYVVAVAPASSGPSGLSSVVVVMQVTFALRPGWCRRFARMRRGSRCWNQSRDRARHRAGRRRRGAA